MAILSPNIYRPGIKFSLQSQNKIDTVNMRPISNIAADAQVYHVESVTAVTLNQTHYTLPLSNAVAPTHWRSISNTHWVNIIWGDEELAKARIECVLVSGTTLCKTEQVVKGTPAVAVRLHGVSHRVARGGSTYDKYPSADNLNDGAWSLAAWIEQNKTETSDSLTHDYSGETFSMNPWVRNVVPLETGIDPVANDVITEWVRPNDGINETYVWWKNWLEKSNYIADGTSKFLMRSPNAVSYDLEIREGTVLEEYNSVLPISAAISKLDDYNFEVSWTVPVRVAYAAASQCIEIVSRGDVDNFAFLDNVTEIAIELSGIPYATDVRNISYSLDSSGNLTENVLNNHPIEIDAGETFTLGSFYYERDDLENMVIITTPWTEKLAGFLLSKYKDGKYVVTCDVPAVWALRNKVHVGKILQVQLPSGEFIARGGITCDFVVKNITKKYKKDDFTFSLSLLED